MRWLQRRLDIPSREDYYAMRIALEINRAIGGTGETDLNKFRVDFKTPESSLQEQSGVDPEAVWGAILLGAGRNGPRNRKSDRPSPSGG